MASNQLKINQTDENYSAVPSFVSNKKNVEAELSPSQLRVDLQSVGTSQSAALSEQTSPGVTAAVDIDQFELKQSQSKKKSKKGRKNIGSNSEAAGAGCCFGFFGSSSKKSAQKNKPVLPEAREDTDQMTLSPNQKEKKARNMTQNHKSYDPAAKRRDLTLEHEQQIQSVDPKRLHHMT